MRRNFRVSGLYANRRFLIPTDRRNETAYEPGAIHVGCSRHRKQGAARCG